MREYFPSWCLSGWVLDDGTPRDQLSRSWEKVLATAGPEEVISNDDISRFADTDGIQQLVFATSDDIA
jgi:hypothetical protein